MKSISDRPTPIERKGAPDCLVELTLVWLQRPLAGLGESQLAAAIAEVCLLISQMRHVPAKAQDIERSRWTERVRVKLCSGCPGMAGYEGAIQVELERRMILAMLVYHEWQEKIAPVVERAVGGPSESGELSA